MKKLISFAVLVVSLVGSLAKAELFSVQLTPVLEEDRAQYILEHERIAQRVFALAHQLGDDGAANFSRMFRWSEKEDVPESVRPAMDKLIDLEGKILAASIQDYERYSQFLKKPNTGLARIMPANQQNKSIPSGGTPYSFLFTRGGGSFFQFKDRSHFHGFGSDIAYRTFLKEDGSIDYGYFRAGFVNSQIAFMGELGLMNISKINLKHPLIEFARSYRPPTKKEDWAAEDDQFGEDLVKTFNPFETGIEQKLKDQEKANVTPRVPALVGATYVVRSMIFENYDTVTVFQVVRKDEIDGSLVIAWEILDDFDLGKVTRPNRSNRENFHGFPGTDGKDGKFKIFVGNGGQKLGFPNVISTKAKYKFLLRTPEYQKRGEL